MRMVGPLVAVKPSLSAGRNDGTVNDGAPLRRSATVNGPWKRHRPLWASAIFF